MQQMRIFLSYLFIADTEKAFDRLEWLFFGEINGLEDGISG